MPDQVFIFRCQNTGLDLILSRIALKCNISCKYCSNIIKTITPLEDVKEEFSNGKTTRNLL